VVSQVSVRLLTILSLIATATSAALPPEFLVAARAQVGVTVLYDAAYVSLKYPGGDVPPDRGVCTDVVIRAMRKTGFDLQKAVHDDMKAAFGAYPTRWGLKRPDPNIDHRRVPNLMKFFERSKKGLPVSKSASAYRPGDFVTCIVPPNLPHIMIVSDRFSTDDPTRPLIIHNIGQGAKEEDRLFEFELTGHYRWWP
jgi:uncharacterized protein YijF (DUF1287 family)